MQIVGQKERRFIIGLIDRQELDIDEHTKATLM
jgi:hypothetical protein